MKMQTEKILMYLLLGTMGAVALAILFGLIGFLFHLI